MTVAARMAVRMRYIVAAMVSASPPLKVGLKKGTLFEVMPYMKKPQAITPAITAPIAPAVLEQPTTSDRAAKTVESGAFTALSAVIQPLISCAAETSVEPWLCRRRGICRCLRASYGLTCLSPWA